MLKAPCKIVRARYKVGILFLIADKINPLFGRKNRNRPADARFLKKCEFFERYIFLEKFRLSEKKNFLEKRRVPEKYMVFQKAYIY